MFKVSRSFVSLFIALALFSCGYHFSGGGVLPAGVERIFLVIFDNRTSEIGVENDLAAALANTFTTIGNKDVLVNNRQKADAELNGTINKIEIYTVSRRTETVSAERRVLITASARLISIDGRTLWQSDALSVTQAYRVASENQETEADRRRAISDASVLLAQKIFNNLTSNF
jgi:outer membrane lipopolysaccharide assembly protein LptE/RlpB